MCYPMKTYINKLTGAINCHEPRYVNNDGQNPHNSINDATRSPTLHSTMLLIPISFKLARNVALRLMHIQCAFCLSSIYSEILWEASSCRISAAVQPATTGSSCIAEGCTQVQRSWKMCNLAEILTFLTKQGYIQRILYSNFKGSAMI